MKNACSSNPTKNEPLNCNAIDVAYKTFITGLKEISILSLFISFLFFLEACEKDNGKNSDANLLEIELEGQIGVAEANVANAEFTCMIYSSDYANVKIKRMIISENATSSVKVGESLNLNHVDNIASITITSETGVQKVYTIRAAKFVVPEFIGEWTFTNECFFQYTYCNEDGTGCGQDFYGSLSSDDYGTYFLHGDQFYDNTLKLEFSNVDGSGNLNGTYTYEPGVDGQIGSFEIVTNGGETLDLNENFTRLFPGDGSWKLNPVNNEITFYNADKSKQSLTYSNGDDKTHWQIETTEDGKTQLTIWLKIDRTGMPSDHDALLQYGYNATTWVLGGYMIGFKMTKE